MITRLSGMGLKALFLVAVFATFSSQLWAAESAKPAEAAPEKPPVTVGVILYPGFEPLDVFGPVEMFMNVGAKRMKVIMVAQEAGPVSSGTTVDGVTPLSPKVVADYGFKDAPQIDIILLPGGQGTLKELNNPVILDFLRERSAKAQITTSVCSGSAILAKAGLLDGIEATSNKAFFMMMRAQGPNVKWVEKARWVDAGKFVTSSGVSAGMDMALAVIARLYGTETAEAIAKGTEYTWHRDSKDDPFARPPAPVAKAKP